MTVHTQCWRVESTLHPWRVEEGDDNERNIYFWTTIHLASQGFKHSETMRNEKKEPEGKNRGRSDSIATAVSRLLSQRTGDRNQMWILTFLFLTTETTWPLLCAHPALLSREILKANLTFPTGISVAIYDANCSAVTIQIVGPFPRNNYSLSVEVGGYIFKIS